MRMRATLGRSDILHWQMMLFAGQDVVEFSAAAHSPSSSTPVTPYTDSVDDAVFSTDDPPLTNSFRKKFDTLWGIPPEEFSTTPTSRARLTACTGTFALDPALNFTPAQDYTLRAVARYAASRPGWT